MAGVTATETDLRAPDGEPDIEYVPGISYPKVAVLVALAAVLGGVLGWLGGGRAAEQEAGGTEGDVGVAVDMRTHHQQALEMSLLELANGQDPIVVGFAREILVRQNVELGLLAAELDDWGVDAADRPDTAMGWMGHPVPWQEMPGLASEAQMDELRDATGRDADARFLELIAAHHRGGVQMAAYAVEHATAEDIRSLARTMAATQTMEIAELADTARRLDLDVDIDTSPIDGGDGGHEGEHREGAG